MRSMKKGILQAVLVLVLLALGGGIYLVGQHILSLPFVATNKALHENNSALTLDFLIPAGTYLDEKLSISEVIQLRLKKQNDPFEKLLRTVCAPIPPGYRFLTNVLLFCFWTVCYLTLFRVFTFMGYGRALRGSLFLGGLTYYFMPDVWPGKGDDILFLLFPVLIIVLRFYAVQRKKRSVFKKA